MVPSGLHSQQLPNIAQVDNAIETKHHAQGHKPVGTSGLELRVK